MGVLVDPAVEEPPSPGGVLEVELVVHEVRQAGLVT